MVNSEEGVKMFSIYKVNNSFLPRNKQELRQAEIYQILYFCNLRVYNTFILVDVQCFESHTIKFKQHHTIYSHFEQKKKFEQKIIKLSRKCLLVQVGKDF